MAGGRPTVVTQEVLQKLEQAYALDCTDGEACLFADIAVSTLYNYQKEFPQFLERKKELKHRPVLKARTTVVNNLDDPEMAFKYLEKKKKDEFSSKTETDVTTGGEKIGMTVYLPSNSHANMETSTQTGAGSVIGSI